MDAAAARRRHPGVAIAILIALAGVGLAGCETTSLFGSTASVANPEPIQQAAPQKALAKVTVAPIIGAPDGVAKQIHQDFVSAIEKQRVAIANRDERADYTLRGYIVAAKDKNATKVSYIWDVTDPAGKRVNRITGEEVISGNAAKDPWAALTPQVARAISDKAAASFGSWLPTQSGQAAVAAVPASHPAGVGAQPAPTPIAAADPPPAAETAEAPARSKSSTSAAAAVRERPAATTGSIAREGPVTAVVPSVTGAPGDGPTTLTAAIQQELTSKGIAVASKASPGAYRVEGAVTMGEGKEGKQPIHIEWTVKDPAGKKLGTVSQRNEIPEGSLNGAWGKTAEQAAGAAAQGILKLLPQPQG